MRARDGLAGQLVDRGGEPFGEPAAVDEDQRRAVRANELDQPRMDRRPDRGAAGGRGRAARELAPVRAATCPRLGTSIESFSGRLTPASTIVTGRKRDDRRRSDANSAWMSCWTSAASLSASPGRARRFRSRRRRPCRRTPDAAEKPRDFVERALRRRQADPLHASCAQRFQPLERERQVRAPLGRHQRVDLVDDDRLERSQHVARVRREQQVQRFGRGDEDIRRLALESARSAAGVSPVRMATAGMVTGTLAAAAAWAMPTSGARRLRSTSMASALSGET